MVAGIVMMVLPKSDEQADNRGQNLAYYANTHVPKDDNRQRKVLIGRALFSI